AGGVAAPSPPPPLAVNRVLDLHALGAEVREQLRGERHRLHLLDGEDADPRERPVNLLRHALLHVRHSGMRGYAASCAPLSRAPEWGLKPPSVPPVRTSITGVTAPGKSEGRSTTTTRACGVSTCSRPT